MFENIPEELKKLPQWVCVALNKEPLNPATGKLANVVDPSTWSSFEKAVHASRGGGIGFVFTKTDPYVFIDLDDPHKLADRGPDAVKQALGINTRIFEAFDSYTELSQSGKGVHIICRATVPQGTRRSTVELYGAERYAIFTGNVIKPQAITEQQALVDRLYAEMHPAPIGGDLVNIASNVTDEQVVDMAGSAVNGEKFNKLCSGDWQQAYPSQSEADFALLSMLCFYTPDNEQVRRLFRMSALGKRLKATKNDKYLDGALRKIRAGEAPPVDLSKLDFDSHKKAAQVIDGPTLEGPGGGDAPTASAELLVPLVPSLHESFPLPPGLVGQVADYIYRSAFYPMPEAAIAGALALVAGIAGRSYNISRTGLNQYLILLAPTGSGKEGAATGIDNILREVRMTVPSITSFKGPSVFSSGQGLLRVLNTKACFVSVLGEFGLTLQQISSPRANSAEVMLRRVLLDLYTKSGWGRVLDEMAYSDTSKNTAVVISPCVTILGESVPTRFYENLDVGSVEEGLVPRFLIIESNNEPDERNLNAGFAPDPTLVKSVADLATVALMTANNNTCCQVQTNDSGQAVLDTFERMCNKNRKGSLRGVDKELWSRAYLKALKLAALIAVGCDFHRPTITSDNATWACNLVQRTTTALVTRFEAGEVGQGEIQHESEIRKALLRYVQMTKPQRLNAKCPADCVDHDVIPFAYLRQQLRRRASFRDSRAGLVRAIELAVQDAVNAGILVPITTQQALSLGIRSRAWAIGAG